MKFYIQDTLDNMLKLAHVRKQRITRIKLNYKLLKPFVKEMSDKRILLVNPLAPIEGQVLRYNGIEVFPSRFYFISLEVGGLKN